MACSASSNSSKQLQWTYAFIVGMVLTLSARCVLTAALRKMHSQAVVYPIPCFMSTGILIVLAEQMCVFCQRDCVFLILHLLRLCEGLFFLAHFTLTSTWILTRAPHETFFLIHFPN